MPRIERSKNKSRIYFYIGAMIILFGIVLVWNVVFSSLSPGTSGLAMPFIGGGGGHLPEIPKIYPKNSIFEKIQTLQFNSFVNLPVEAGAMGRINPFEPTDGSTIEGGGGSNSSSGGSSGGSDTIENPNISQGTK